MKCKEIELAVGLWPIGAIRTCAMVLGLGLVVAGCQALPGSGPPMYDTSSTTTDVLPFDVINLTPTTVVAYRPEAAAKRAPVVNAEPIGTHFAVGPGDVLKVSIVDRYAGGIFATMQQPNVSVVSPRVSVDGTIDVPFVGTVLVAGKDLRQIEAEILGRLGGKANDPQVIVELAADRTNTVVVSGEVVRPGRLSLLEGTRSVVEAISRAGGPLYPPVPKPGGSTGSASPTSSPYSLSPSTVGSSSGALAPSPRVVRGPTQMQVVVRRQGKVILDQPLSDLLAGGDIALRKGDEIVVVSNSQVLTVLGAVQRAGNVAVTKPDMTLADALGEVSGLFDLRANPTGVYVFRLADPHGSPDVHGKVFRLDLLQPVSIFVAQQFAVRAKDVIYVTNSPLNEYDKALTPLYRTFAVVGTARGN